MQKRSISESFLNSLKAGLFKSIVDIVRIDPSLDMEMRGDTVMVYYRVGWQKHDTGRRSSRR